jgi:TPR repeat protein
MVNLGYCYMFGRGVAMDKKAAFSWYEKAAKLDFPLGTYNLGVCYANGQGVATDEKIAFDYFLEAANGGSANARHDLVRCYRDGIGTSPDAVQAQIWTDKIFSDLPYQPDWEGEGVLGLPSE